MKLLVTGGSGFLGKHLCDILGKEYDLHIVGTKKDVNKVETFKDIEFPYYVTDYSVESLKDIFEKIKPDAVVHLAGLRLKPDKKFPNNYITNLNVSAYLFQVCLNSNINNIVNISTIGLYSQINEFPWKEIQNPSPQNPYALSKHWVEQTAEYFNNKGLQIKTLRLAQVIGYGEREGYLLQIYAENAKKGLPLTVFGECKGKRHYVYVNDVVAAIKAALLKPELKGIFMVLMNWHKQ